MDKPALVRGVEREADPGDQPDGYIGRKAALLLEHGSEVGPVDQAHCDVEPTPVLPGAVGRHDVRVLDRRHELGLAAEPVAEVPVGGEPSRDHLQRDDASERLVPRAVHDAHAPATNSLSSTYPPIDSPARSPAS